jgi:hypothetical protein
VCSRLSFGGMPCPRNMTCEGYLHGSELAKLDMVLLLGGNLSERTKPHMPLLHEE